MSLLWRMNEKNTKLWLKNHELSLILSLHYCHLCKLGYFIFSAFILFFSVYFQLWFKGCPSSAVDRLTDWNKQNSPPVSPSIILCVHAHVKKACTDLKVEGWRNSEPQLIPILIADRWHVVKSWNSDTHGLSLPLCEPQHVHNLYCQCIFKKRKSQKNTEEMTQWPRCMFTSFGGCPLFCLFYLNSTYCNFLPFFKSEEGWMVVGLRV